MASSSSSLLFHLHLHLQSPKKPFFSPFPSHHKPLSLHLPSKPHHLPSSFSSSSSSSPSSSSSNHHHHDHHLLSPLLKPITLTLVSAGLLLLLPRRPSLASTPPTPITTTSSLSDEEKAQIVEDHLDLHPDDAPSLRSLLELRARSGRFSDAVSAADRLLPLLPHDDLDIPLLRAHLLTHSGDLPSSRAAFHDLLLRDPFLVDAYHGLVMAAALDDDPSSKASELAAVVERIEGVVEKCRKEGKKKRKKEVARDLKLLVAQVRVIEGKYEEAIGLYEKLVREEPRDFRPYLCQGIVYSIMQRKVDAERVFEKYHRLVPRGHPYARYFEENVLAMKAFGRRVEEEEEREEKGAALRM